MGAISVLAVELAVLLTASPSPPPAKHHKHHHHRIHWHRSEASVYGEGDGQMGNTLACGGRYRPGLRAVAHKRLPCGTRVILRYHGRTVTVPVRDRGPYVAGRDFDLTAATRRALRFPIGVDVVRWRLAP